MTCLCPIITLSPRDYDAVLFDLDGVLTRTASVHASAWKKLFDRFLEQRAKQTGEPFVPFDLSTDYPRYVDGKPRYDGVRDFLGSRGIGLPEGSPDDPATAETVCGLGNRKNDAFNSVLERDGVTPYPGSVLLLDHLRGLGLPLGVVSSSANAPAVLEAAGLLDRFGTVVSGTVAHDLGLRGSRPPTRSTTRPRCWAPPPPAPSCSRTPSRGSARAGPGTSAWSSASTAAPGSTG